MRAGATVIIASHNMENIKKYCDKVILMDNGEIVMIGKPKEVIEKYLGNV